MLPFFTNFFSTICIFFRANFCILVGWLFDEASENSFLHRDHQVENK